MNFDEIRAELQQLAVAYKSLGEDIRWYLFGSIIKIGSSPSDVDLLIIYEASDEPARLRRYLIDFSIRYPLHLVFVTKEEEEYFGFTRFHSNVLIFPVMKEV